MSYHKPTAALHRHLLPFVAFLLFIPSCMHKKAVVWTHNTGTGQDSITYRGKAISPEELYELGEKAGEGKVDLILQQDGQTEKLDLKRWHTGMQVLPELMQSRSEEPE